MRFELEIQPDCEYEDFYKAASTLEGMGYSFSDKVDGFDSLYWDFELEGNTLTLSYNVYDGMSLSVRDSESLTESQKDIMTELAEKLK